MNTSILHLYLPNLKKFKFLKRDVFMVESFYLPNRIVGDLVRFKSHIQIYIYNKKNKPPLMRGFFTYGNYADEKNKLVNLYINKTQGQPESREFSWKSAAYATELQDYSRQGYRSALDFDLQQEKLIKLYSQVSRYSDELVKFMEGPVIDEICEIQLSNFYKVMAAARACGLKKLSVSYGTLSVNGNKEGFYGFGDGSVQMFSDLIGSLGGGGGHYGTSSVQINGSAIDQLFPQGMYYRVYNVWTENEITRHNDLTKPFFRRKVSYAIEYVWDRIRDQVLSDQETTK